MRRLLPFILTLLALSALAGCASKAAPMLDRAEEAMEPHPDSALSILQAIRTTDLIGDDERARYALLLTQAMDKNYIDVTDDSLIAVADSYYRRASDPRRRMLAAFYHGRVRFNASDYPRALQLFSESLDLASALPDTFWMARSASEKAAIYRVNSRFKDERYYARLAYKWHEALKIQPQWNYAILDLGMAYLNTEEYEQAIKLTQPLLDSAQTYQNAELEEYASITIAKALFSTHRFEEVIDLLEKLNNVSDYTNDRICILGKSYIYTDNLHKADSIAATIDITSSHDPVILSFAAELSKASDNLSQTLNLTERLLYANDSLHFHALEQNFAQGHNEYHQHLRELNNLKRAKSRQQLVWILVTGLVIIFAVSALFYQKYINQRNTIASQINEIQNIQRILSIKTTAETQSQAVINEMLTSRFKILDSLCKTYYENQATSVLHKKIGESVSNLISDFSVGSSKIEELIQLVNQTHENIYTDFHRELSSLKEADYMLFIYCALGFSSSTIALFLKEDNVNPVYYRKKRLKAKIKLLDSANKDRFLSILS